MNSIRVLIAEDDSMVADINKNFIEAVRGFEVVNIVSNGSDVMCQIRRCAPDLVILDFTLPGKNGVEILAALRQEGQAVDVIMMTAVDDKSTIRKALRLGIVSYIVKPFKFEQLRTTLEKYLICRARLVKQCLN